MATIKDIAQIVGVSNATVSRVLNYDESISVSIETKQSIFKTADELGYKKKIVYPKIKDIALIYSSTFLEELEDAYFKSIKIEMEKQAKERNINIKVYDKHDGINKISKQTSAFIAIGWYSRKDVEFLKTITEHGVFVDTAPDESSYDSVRPNLDSIVTQIVDYFISNKHTNIGFMGCTDFDIITKKPVMDVREWSFRESAKYYNVLNEKNIFITDKLTVDEGYRMGIEAIEKLGKDLPTAFCIASDTFAVGFLQALNEKGIKVPDEVAVFSINDIKIAQYVAPPLSTYHIDIPMMCKTTLDLLTERIIEGRTLTKTVYINGKPIFRKSC